MIANTGDLAPRLRPRLVAGALRPGNAQAAARVARLELKPIDNSDRRRD
jgi:hypothetical protein